MLKGEGIQEFPLAIITFRQGNSSLPYFPSKEKDPPQGTKK